MKQEDVSIIKQKDLVRILKDNYSNKSDTRFTFLLGAGASVQSDIPSASKLANIWIEEIKEDIGNEYKDWIKKNNIKEKDPAFSYTKIYQKRFEHNHRNGFEFLQNIMDGKQPSIGYSILSQILVDTKHNFVITTNFDSLIEDALFLFTSKRPLVCGHESLSDFIKLNSTRPTIIKVHRDILLNPYNRPDNTCTLEKPLESALKPILSNSPMIIIGYGGNDESIMNFLKSAQRENIYWCIRNIKDIPQKILNVITSTDKIVEIEGFDELMVALQAKVYKFESINTLKAENVNDSLIVKNALEKVDLYKKQLTKFEEEVKTSKSEDFKENSKTILPNWWEYELKVQEEKDIEKKEEIYKQGISDYPKSHELIETYAIFLSDIRKDFNKAEFHHKKALEIKPNDANYNGNYANFLKNIRKDFNKTEFHYKKALEIEPNHANNNGNYANFIKDIRKDFNKAEFHYKKALEIQPNHANNNGNYASFLLIQNKKDLATKYFEIAFNQTSDHADLLCELWFYKLAHYRDEYQEAKLSLDKLLEDGFVSEYWDFTQNIQHAIKENHPNIDVLKEYAFKISGIDYKDVA